MNADHALYIGLCLTAFSAIGFLDRAFSDTRKTARAIEFAAVSAAVGHDTDDAPDFEKVVGGIGSCWAGNEDTENCANRSCGNAVPGSIGGASQPPKVKTSAPTPPVPGSSAKRINEGRAYAR